ncbi:hypothetical protein [Vallitalea okinawensis]|uniref:hypothetical protein n=1 Tax=Vallitalea okinawensis TaxID=2078660 RepID=UPI000CFE0F08|nr:hypothetical protein [Vallitalea okinawensis]
MATMINQWEHIKKQRIKYGALFIGCCILVLVGFLLNSYLKADYYFYILFVNILIVLATAYFGVKFIMYLPFKISPDGNRDLLNQLSDQFCIINGVLLNNENYRAYFEHVIVGTNKIYFIHLGGQDARKVKQYNIVIKDIINSREMKTGFKIVYDQIDFENLMKQLASRDNGPVTQHQKKIVDTIKHIAV